MDHAGLWPRRWYALYRSKLHPLITIEEDVSQEYLQQCNCGRIIEKHRASLHLDNVDTVSANPFTDVEAKSCSR